MTVFRHDPLGLPEAPCPCENCREYRRASRDCRIVESLLIGTLVALVAVRVGALAWWW